jgi:hypothetical protein
MWKSREEKIKEQFRPEHLYQFINSNGEEADLDTFLINFKMH